MGEMKVQGDTVISKMIASKDVILDIIGDRQKELEKELSSIVYENSSELLNRAREVKHLKDTALELKEKIRFTKKKTMIAASAITTPLMNVKNATKRLSATVEASKKLRLLSRFLSLYRQVENEDIKSPIVGNTNVIRNMCEIQKIADLAVLNRINAFQTFWTRVKPKCEFMISTATVQFAEGINEKDLSKAISAAMVFDCLGTLEKVSKTFFEKETSEFIGSFTNSRSFASSREVIALLLDTMRGIPALVDKISVLKQVVTTSRQRSTDLFVEHEEFEFIEPLEAIRTVSKGIELALEEICREKPSIASDIADNIPIIRNETIAAVDKLSSYAFKPAFNQILLDSLAPFYSAFVSSFIKDAHNNRLFGMFSQKKSLTRSQITQFLSWYEDELSKFDKELLYKMKDPTIKMAHDYSKLMSHSNSVIQGDAVRYADDIRSGLQHIAAKFFSKEAADSVDKAFRAKPKAKK